MSKNGALVLPEPDSAMAWRTAERTLGQASAARERMHSSLERIATCFPRSLATASVFAELRSLLVEAIQ